jgi:hypothetical protein
MTDNLEQRLAALATALDVPRAPDLVPAVMARLPERRGRRTVLARRSLALALAAVLLLAGAAMAVPSTRHTILRVLGLRGVSIERVPSLPPLPQGRGTALGLGRRIPVSRARDAASFAALLPPHPTAAYVNRDVAGGRVSVLSGRVLITEFRGTTIPVVYKLIGPGTRVARVRIDGGAAIYLYGAPHEVIFMVRGGEIRSERVRLQGSVLIWQQGPVTLLIEGTHSLGGALSVARSLR